MVLVEFFDSEPIDNLVGALTLKSEKIFLVGESKYVTSQSQRYNSFLEHRTELPLFVPVPVVKSDINKIVDKLSEIVVSCDECCFDMTGGEDTALVAVGMVYERYRSEKRIYLHRYNIGYGSFSLFEKRNDKAVEHFTPHITVAESIALHGGSVSPDEFKDNFSGGWNFTSELEAEVNSMWEISCRNPTRWNKVLGMLNAWESIKEASDTPLRTTVKISNAENIVKNSRNDINTVCRMLFEMALDGLILNFTRNDKEISFTYKNSNVKRCLSKAGNVLELKTVMMARKVKDEHGEPFYDSFDIQVSIDWDGKYHDACETEKDTTNEIDVVLMKGLVPIFISCKNGIVNDDELYKLNTVTQRFGGKYAKKVLIATHLGKNSEEAAEYFRQRAKDMGIILVDNVHEMDDKSFISSLKSLPSRKN